MVSNIPCSYTTPFGGPVLPEVKKMAATSSGCDGSGGNGRHGSLRSSSSRVEPPQNSRRPTVTLVSTVRNLPGDSTRSACASGMPM